MNTLQPMQHLNDSPETSLLVTFRLKLSGITGKEQCKQAAFRAMCAVIHDIIPNGRGRILRPIGRVPATVLLIWSVKKSNAITCTSNVTFQCSGQQKRYSSVIS